MLEAHHTKLYKLLNMIFIILDVSKTKDKMTPRPRPEMKI